VDSVYGTVATTSNPLILHETLPMQEPYQVATTAGMVRSDDTKESHPHRIANRDIQFPDPKDLNQEESTLIQNLNSDIQMIEDDVCTNGIICRMETSRNTESE
jgi:hypothetical protein